MKAHGNKTAARGRKILTGRVIAAAIWLAVIVAAMALIARYSNAPGSSGAPPSQWPAPSRIALASDRPTLLMFAHPHCPCTRASMGEFELLMAGAQGRVNAHVLFIQPPGMSNDWTNTDLWRKASSIPGVVASRDDNGTEARLFHSDTSGQTLLYDPSGKLLFQGGITMARGHSGDNPGRDALEAMLKGESARQARTPVFGCSLFDTECLETNVTRLP